MKKCGKKFTALLLAVCVLLTAAACGKSGSGDDSSEEKLSGTVYVPEFIKCELDVEHINSACSDGQYIYMVAEISEEVQIPVGDTVLPEDFEASDGGRNGIAGDDIAVDGVVVGGDAVIDTLPDTGFYTDYVWRTGIFRLSMDGKEAVELENYEPAVAFDNGNDGWSNINGIQGGQDGTLWVTEWVETYQYELPADFDPVEDAGTEWDYFVGSTSAQIMRQLDSTGAEIRRIDTTGLNEKIGVEYINNTCLGKDGEIYVFTDTEVFVLDESMNILFNVTGENLWGNVVRLNDGTVGISVWGSEGGQILRTIDPAAKDWGAEYPLPTSANSVYAGSGEYLFYYDNSDSLYGYSAEKKEGEKILSWSGSDINSGHLMFFTFMEDGRIVAMTRKWTDNGNEMELAILTEQPASVLADKTILTYACMYLQYDVREKIIDFNRGNSKYRIEVRDYSEFNTAEDYSAGLTKLNTEILAGNVPDIFSTNSLPLRQYGARGILEDLWPLIESDPEIGRENLMENVFRAVEQDGKLYQVFRTFSINTVVGAPSVVGDEMGWTLDELRAALANMPEGCQIFNEGDTKSSMLNTVLNNNLDNYVDWATGQCYFDSEDFKSALEFCNSFPLEYDWEKVNWEEQEDEPTRIMNGRQMLMPLYVYDLESLQMYKAMFGGAMTFVGYPSETGIGSSFNISSGMAISSTCKDKAGAWSFVRELLLPESVGNENYYGYEFSTNKTDFDATIKRMMTKEYQLDENGQPLLDENGQPIEQSKGGWGWGSLEIEIFATSQEEYDQFMALYNAIDTVNNYDEDIYDIVLEMANAYFNGDKTLEDTVMQIQSRVKLYVNEQR